MKRILPFLVLVGLALSGGALAQPPPPGPPAPPAPPVEVETLPTVQVIPTLEKIANLIFTVLLALVAIMIVVAGVMFVMAGGNPEQVARARNMIMYALIGLIVAFLARGIIAFIKGYLV